MWNGPSLQPPAVMTSPFTFMQYQELQKGMSLKEQLMNERTQQEVSSEGLVRLKGCWSTELKANYPPDVLLEGLPHGHDHSG